MEEEHQETAETPEKPDTDLRGLIQQTISEYLNVERSRVEPTYKAELTTERKRREQLERRVNELVAESERNRRKAEEAERYSAIRGELQKIGLSKLDLAFKAVKEDIYRNEAGELVARTKDGELSYQEFLAQFAKENPELLPARIPGGSGASNLSDALAGDASFGLERLRPGMDPEERRQIRQQIAQATRQIMPKS